MYFSKNLNQLQALFAADSTGGNALPVKRPRIRAFPMGVFEANAYLIETDENNVLIDPGSEPSVVMPELPRLSAIICTHGHFDHIAGADVVRKLTGAPLWIHADDADALTDPLANASQLAGRPLRQQPADRLLADEDEIELDVNHKLLVIATPGHSPGGICLLLLEGKKPLSLFSGDTLFQGSIGRLDLGGDPQAMAASLARLMKLPDSVQVFPGHGPATTIGRERETNPYLQGNFDLL